VEEAIARHGEEGYPGEACGLLLGRVEEGLVTVVEAVRGRNVCEKGREGDRYVVEPRDVLSAMKEAEKAGMEVVGVYHSHPDHPAAASRTDAELAWEGWAYVIVSVVRGKAGEIAAWALRGGGAMEPVGLVSWS
jgi:proteasome lid subunit RPN8/RPN11